MSELTCLECLDGHHGFHDSDRGTPSSMCGCWCLKRGEGEPPLLIPFSIDVEPEGDACIAWVPALDVRAIEKTPEEARQNAREVATSVLREREALARNVRLAETDPAGFARKVERLSAHEDDRDVANFVISALRDLDPEQIVTIVISLDPGKLSPAALMTFISALAPVDSDAAGRRFTWAVAPRLEGILGKEWVREQRRFRVGDDVRYKGEMSVGTVEESTDLLIKVRWAGGEMLDAFPLEEAERDLEIAWGRP